MTDAYDILILLVAVVIWAAVVLPDYALAQHLRATLDAKSREKGLYHYARQSWEARFLIWGAIAGGVGGALTREQLTLLSVVFIFFASLIGVLLIGFGSMLVAGRAGYGSDFSNHPARAIYFSALGLVVFSLATVSVKLTRGQASQTDWVDSYVPGLATIATLVGITGGLISIWRALRKD